AAGKPVIAPRLGQIAEIVREEETGLLYTPGQVDALAQRLLALATQVDLRAALGSQAAQDARRRFTWKATARKVVAISEETRMELSACRAPPSSRRESTGLDGDALVGNASAVGKGAAGSASWAACWRSPRSAAARRCPRPRLRAA